MILWIGITALLIAAIGLVVWPFLRVRGRSVTRAEAEVAVYRDQLRELEKESKRGVIGSEEAGAARLEIQRRLLRAASQNEGEPTNRTRQPVVALCIAVVLAGAVSVLYGYLGSPILPDRPFAQRQGDVELASAQGADIETRIQALAGRVEADPDNIEAWWLLGQSYIALDRYSDAADAFRGALAVADDDPRILSAYAETLMMAHGNRVVVAAREAFEQVLQQVPDDPRARFYLGLAAAQNREFQDALDAWLTLHDDSPEDAPWRAALRNGIVDMANQLGLDPNDYLPNLTVAELAAPERDGANPSAMLEEIDTLRARLEAKPKDYEGWLMLAQAEAARGDLDAAGAAIGQVRQLYPNVPFVQQQINSVEAALGLTERARRGPTDEDINAAAEMSQQDQLAMINSMVGGLAERLEQDPNDLEGWMMLIRSYSVLGMANEARGAYGRAQDHYSDEPASSAQLSALANGLRLNR